MFQRMEITLDGPICPCEERKLSWSVPANPKGQPYLVIHCTTCGAKLEVPNEHFKARISLQRGYPNDIKAREVVEAKKKAVEKVEKKKEPADVIDFMSHLKKRRAEDDLPS